MKILFVDDNKYVVEALKKKLNWKAYGIDEVFGCCSVEEAETLFEEHEIDFLFTDIEMPEQDGFDLISGLKERGKDPETVLLTSYADFAYAQRAVKYNCFDYLLKPVETGALESVIQKMVKKRIEDSRKKQLEQYGTDWLSHQPLVREMFWWDIVREGGFGSRKQLERRIRKDGLPYRAEGRYVIVLICLVREREEFDHNLLKFTCGNILDEIASEREREPEFLAYNGYAQFVTLFSAEREGDYGEVCDIMERFADVFSSFYRTQITCYLSEITDILNINAHERKLEEFYLDDLNRKKGIFLERDFEKADAWEEGTEEGWDSQNSYLAPDTAEWGELIRNGNLEGLSAKVHRYFETLRERGAVSEKLLRAVFTDWTRAMAGILKDYNITTYQMMEEYRNRERAELASGDICGLERLIVEEAGRIVHRVRYLSREDLVIRDMKVYIREHLSTVTRSQIAGNFYLSPNYVSKLFSRLGGVSLSEYIQQERMEYARQQLRQTEKSISRIAEEAGYPSFAWFSKQFKKVNGMTPNEYRKSVVKMRAADEAGKEEGT